MRAAFHKKYGPPSVVKVKNVPKPYPKPGEVLVEVYATSVNRTDCGVRAAKPFLVRFFFGFFRPRRKILGNEFAGTIEAVGQKVTAFNKGDKVFGYCEPRFGAHAEYVTVKEDKMITRMPKGMNYETAATMTEGAHYALYFIKAGEIKNGTKVLVNGASGGIGSAAVQILKHFGADVVATCNTKNMKVVQSLKPRKIINYEKVDFTEDKEKYDLVFDAVGKSSYLKCRKLIKPGGIYISSEFGPKAQNPLFTIYTYFMGGYPFGTNGTRVKFPIPGAKKEDAEFLKELFVRKKFKPVIDKKYPLDKIVDAYKYVETGEKTGNVIIKVK